MRRAWRSWLGALGCLTGAVQAQGFLDYTGGLMVQDFDGLPKQGSFTLPAKGPFDFSAAPLSATGMEGWQFHANTGPKARFQVGAGIADIATTASFGLPGDDDRALGAIAAASYKSRTGLILRNATGQTLTQVSLA